MSNSLHYICSAPILGNLYHSLNTYHSITLPKIIEERENFQKNQTRIHNYTSLKILNKTNQQAQSSYQPNENQRNNQIAFHTRETAKLLFYKLFSHFYNLFLSCDSLCSIIIAFTLQNIKHVYTAYRSRHLFLQIKTIFFQKC